MDPIHSIGPVGTLSVDCDACVVEQSMERNAMNESTQICVCYCVCCGYDQNGCRAAGRSRDSKVVSRDESGGARSHQSLRLYGRQRRLGVSIFVLESSAPLVLSPGMDCISGPRSRNTNQNRVREFGWQCSALRRFTDKSHYRNGRQRSRRY
jgi:hypothetical protein